MKTQEYANRGRTACVVAAVVAVLAIAGGAVAIGASNALTAGAAPAAAVTGSALPVSFADMIAKVSPAVANIRVTAGVSATPARMEPRELEIGRAHV